jgi:hypothetical protein
VWYLAPRDPGENHLGFFHEKYRIKRRILRRDTRFDVEFSAEALDSTSNSPQRHSIRRRILRRGTRFDVELSEAGYPGTRKSSNKSFAHITFEYTSQRDAHSFFLVQNVGLVPVTHEVEANNLNERDVLSEKKGRSRSRSANKDKVLIELCSPTFN